MLQNIHFKAFRKSLRSNERKYLSSFRGLWFPSWRARSVCTVGIAQGLETKYDDQQRKTILEVINSSCEEDLVRFSLGKARARGLTKFRYQCGNFEDLETVLKVLDIKDNAFRRFCEAVLFDQDVGGASKFRLSNIITPNDSPEKLNALSSIVGVSVGANAAVTWAEVTKGCELKEWNQIIPTESTTKKLNPCSLFDVVQRACERLPKADAFVLESAPALLPQQVYMQAYIHRREIQATMLALLNTRPPQMNRVFFLCSRFASRLYGIQVGSERVSSQPVVERLLQGSGVGPGSSTYLRVPNLELQASFRAQLGPQREARASALLLAMAFLKLAVLEDQDCLKALRLI